MHIHTYGTVLSCVAFSADDVPLTITGEVSLFIVPLHTEGGTV